MCTRHIIPTYIYLDTTHVRKSKYYIAQRCCSNPRSLDNDPKAGSKETARIYRSFSVSLQHGFFQIDLACHMK